MFNNYMVFYRLALQSMNNKIDFLNALLNCQKINIENCKQRIQLFQELNELKECWEINKTEEMVSKISEKQLAINSLNTEIEIRDAEESNLNLLIEKENKVYNKFLKKYYYGVKRARGVRGWIIFGACLGLYYALTYKDLGYIMMWPVLTWIVSEIYYELIGSLKQ